MILPPYSSIAVAATTAAKKSNPTSIVVPPAIVAMKVKGLQAVLAELKLVLSGGKKSVFGNKSMKAKTKETYNQHIDGMRRFLTLIGDYESLLILQENRPKNAPPVKVESVIAYVRYKCGVPNTPLLTEMDGVPVMDAAGNPILCAGTWNAPNKIDQFQAAMSAVHHNNAHDEGYRNICDDCIATKPVKDSGCQRHSGNARFVRTGNPCTANEYKEEKKNIKADREGWEERGAMWLLASDLREIRNILLSTGSLEDLQLYVFILLCIKLFLRFDEGDNVDMDHFMEKLHAVSSMHRIDGLCVKIKGKCDTSWNYMHLWVDDEYPEFCVPRHLLIYLFVSGIKRGSLFPNHKELNACAGGLLSGGICKTKLGYDTVRVGLLEVTKNIVKYRESITDKTDPLHKAPTRVGTHTGRKTAYLFGTFGGGSLGDLMEAARHKTYDNAMRYASACRALHNLHKKQPIGSSSENEVGLWQSPFIGKDSVLAQAVNRNSQDFSDSLPNLAKRFVLVHLGLSDKDPKLRDIPTLFRKAEEYRRPDSPVEKLMEWQKKHAVNDEDAEQAHKLFHHAVQQRAREMMTRQQNQVNQVGVAPAPNATNAPWPQLPATPPSVHQRSQENTKRV
jgi:hypothetical protein